jgi:2-aminoethylphosphonate-pyruvate transaminase
MLRDWGSRDEAFIAMNHEVRERLVALAGAQETHVCVPLQGSGTFTVEATIGTLVPRDGKLLVLVNGAYGTRMVAIAKVMGRTVEALEWREDEQVDPQAVGECLTRDDSVSHVAVVHCETTSGILNPVQEVAEVVAAHGRPLIIDAVSAFGALPLDVRRTPFAAVAASSNKCLEGVPGMGFALIRREVLEQSKDNAHSLSLDLFAQWKGFEKNGQWRFTPPPTLSPRSCKLSTSTPPKVGCQDGGHAMSGTIRCWWTGWRPLASVACCRGRSRRRSS